MSYAELVKHVESFALVYYRMFPDYPRIYRAHVQLVRRFALELAAAEGADKQVVEIAAILHDIGRSMTRENHHIKDCELAKGLLEEIELSEEKKELILKCILYHRTRFSHEDHEIEIKVIQCADALGTMFVDDWQEHCRRTLKEEQLLELYDKAMGKLNLKSARRIALPQVDKLKRMLDQ